MSQRHFTILSLILLSLTAQAEDTVRVEKIERIEIIGSRNAVELSRTGFSIDSIALSTSAGSSTADLLRRSTPVVVRDYGRGARQSISFRGAASTHTSLYWNSLKINSPIIGDVDFSLLPVYAIDRINIAPGVSAISYGDGALGGVVSIESRANWSKRFSIEALASIGSFSSYDALLAVRAGSDRFESSTKIIYNYSLNDFEFINRDIIDPARPDYRPMVRNKNADYQNIGITQDFFARLDNDQMLTASIMLLDNHRNIPHLTTYEGPDNSNLTASTERSARAAITYKRYGQLLSIEAILGITFEDNTFLQQNFIADKYIPYIDSRSWGRTMQGSVNLTFAHFNRHILRTETSASINDAHSTERVRGTGFDRSRVEISQSLGWYTSWHHKWRTSAVARVGLIGDKLYATGSVAVDYMANKVLTLSFKGGYNQKYPSLSDLYYTPGGNPDLLPERGETLELGVSANWRGLKGRAILYGSMIDDWIIWLPTFAQYWTPMNLRKVVTIGAEFQLSYSHCFGNEWKISANGTLALTRTINASQAVGVNDFSHGQQLPFIPLLSGAASVSGGWRDLSFTYRVEGESEKSNVTSGELSRGSTILATDIHNIAIDYAPWGFLIIRAECRNLFDGRFYGAMRQPLPPRSFSLSLRFRF